jgi:hypothetical protein
MPVFITYKKEEGNHYSPRLGYLLFVVSSNHRQQRQVLQHRANINVTKFSAANINVTKFSAANINVTKFSATCPTCDTAPTPSTRQHATALAEV